MGVSHFIQVLAICISLMILQTTAVTPLNTANIEALKDHLEGDNWNVYVMYFYDSAKNLVDKDLQKNLQNGVLSIYGDNVYYGELDISDPKNKEVLEIIDFDKTRKALIEGHVREKDVSYFNLKYFRYHLQ